MELYVLDDLFRRIRVYDRFESLIWTERDRVLGDFQFVIPSTPQIKAEIPMGCWVSITDSQRLMRVETIEDKEDSEGRQMITFSGRSAEAIYEDRVVRASWFSLDKSPTWNMQGRPADVFYYMVEQFCVVGVLSQKDRIPRLTMGGTIPYGNNPVDDEWQRWNFEPDTLFNTLKLHGDSYGISFAITVNHATNTIHHNTFVGTNRTSMQSVVPALIFTTELDNLVSINELTSIQNEKTVAIVISPFGKMLEVYAPEANPDASGFQRKELIVRVDSITRGEDEDRLTDAQIMQKRGRDALIAHRKVQAVDGEIPQFGLKYNVDYRLSDIVEMRSSTGATTLMRVSEQIFTSDSSGDRSYPTFTAEQFVTPGSWLAWATDDTWDTVQGTWAEK